MKKKLAYVKTALIFFIFSCQYSECANIDSLKMLLTTSTNDSVLISVLNQLSIELRVSQPTEAMDYAIRAEKLAEKLGNEAALADAYQNLATLYANKQNFELAFEYFNKQLLIEQKNGNNPDLANTYHNLGLIYLQQNDFDNALECQIKSLKLKEEINDSAGLANSYALLGNIFVEQEKYDKALINFYKSLRLKESLQDKFGIADSYKNIGIIYLKIESIDQAKINLERGLQLFEEIEDTADMAISLLHLGDIYSHLNNKMQAIGAFERSLNLFTEQENLNGIAETYLKLGNLNQILKQDSMAIKQLFKSLDYYKKSNNILGMVNSRITLARYYKRYERFSSAKEQLDIASYYAHNNKFLEQEKEALSLLAEIYLIDENYKEAAQILNKSKLLSDSLFNKKLTDEVYKTQMQYEFELKTKESEFIEEINELKQEIKSNHLESSRNLLILGLTLSAAIIIIVIFYYQLVRKKNRLLRKQKERIRSSIKILNEHKKQLVEANKTKDKFIAIIGHDLRNPFNAINSLTAILMEHYHHFDENGIQKYLKLIKESGQNAHSLLDNLLDWALSQNGELKPQPEEIALNSLIKGNVLLFNELAEQKKISINQELDNAQFVFTDKNMLNSVIRNLLSNAIKYSHDNSSVLIKTEMINSQIKVIIKDNGPGLSKNKISAILNMTTHVKSGEHKYSQGLGLYLSYDFLKQQNILLHIDSEIDKGTSCYFFLPIVK